MIQFLTHGRVRRTNYSCIATWGEGVARRYRDAAVRRVRPANSRDRRECVRRQTQRTGSPAAAAFGRGFSRRRDTRRCPAGGERDRRRTWISGGVLSPNFPPPLQRVSLSQAATIDGTRGMSGAAHCRSLIVS